LQFAVLTLVAFLLLLAFFAVPGVVDVAGVSAVGEVPYLFSLTFWRPCCY